ncbi:hypothetical protein BKA93DRAFT_752025 [Sparassis latifolia]
MGELDSGQCWPPGASAKIATRRDSRAINALGDYITDPTFSDPTQLRRRNPPNRIRIFGSTKSPPHILQYCLLSPAALRLDRRSCRPPSSTREHTQLPREGRSSTSTSQKDKYCARLPTRGRRHTEASSVGHSPFPDRRWCSRTHNMPWTRSFPTERPMRNRCVTSVEAPRIVDLTEQLLLLYSITRRPFSPAVVERRRSMGFMFSPHTRRASNRLRDGYLFTNCSVTPRLSSPRFPRKQIHTVLFTVVRAMGKRPIRRSVRAESAAATAHTRWPATATSPNAVHGNYYATPATSAACRYSIVTDTPIGARTSNFGYTHCSDLEYNAQFMWLSQYSSKFSIGNEIHWQ